MVRPGDVLRTLHGEVSDVKIGSYGLDQCLDLVQRRMREPGGSAAPCGADWLLGEGVALGMIDTAPPYGHRSEARLCLAEDGLFDAFVGTAEFGNGTSTVHRQVIAEVLSTSPGQIRLHRCDTDLLGHDTGAFGSTGVVVAVRASELAARGMRDKLLAAAKRLNCSATACQLLDGAIEGPDATLTLSELAEEGLTVLGRADASPRSVAFNVQAVRIAVSRQTGEIRVLRSVHAADAGRVLNARQCEGK